MNHHSWVNGEINVNGQGGEIKVSAVIERQGRLMAWRQRQDRESEWVALKSWWAAKRQLHRATTPRQRDAARQTLRRTARLYRAELRRAWTKWAKVDAARRMGFTYHLPEEPT